VTIDFCRKLQLCFFSCFIFISCENADLETDLAINEPTKNDEEGVKLASTTANKDLDKDKILDSVDNCPNIPNKNQNDQDNDKVGDKCDSDIDGDGIENLVDNCKYVSNKDQLDFDNDKAGDKCDPDTDGDGVANSVDNCKNLYNPLQGDFDNDQVGDSCSGVAVGDLPNVNSNSIVAVDNRIYYIDRSDYNLWSYGKTKGSLRKEFELSNFIGNLPGYKTGDAFSKNYFGILSPRGNKGIYFIDGLNKKYYHFNIEKKEILELYGGNERVTSGESGLYVLTNLGCCSNDALPTSISLVDLGGNTQLLKNLEGKATKKDETGAELIYSKEWTTGLISGAVNPARGTGGKANNFFLVTFQLESKSSGGPTQVLLKVYLVEKDEIKNIGEIKFLNSKVGTIKQNSVRGVVAEGSAISFSINNKLLISTKDQETPKIHSFDKSELADRITGVELLTRTSYEESDYLYYVKSALNFRIRTKELMRVELGTSEVTSLYHVGRSISMGRGQVVYLGNPGGSKPIFHLIEKRSTGEGRSRVVMIPESFSKVKEIHSHPFLDSSHELYLGKHEQENYSLFHLSYLDSSKTAIGQRVTRMIATNGDQIIYLTGQSSLPTKKAYGQILFDDGFLYTSCVEANITGCVDRKLYFQKLPAFK
jgi:hypothetical protein